MKLWLLLLPFMLLTSCATMTPPQEPGALSIPVAAAEGRDLGSHDARDGLSNDPYRYRKQVASQNWSDFVDGYLEGYTHGR